LVAKERDSQFHPATGRWVRGTLTNQLPDLNTLTELLAPPRNAVPDVAVTLPTLASYDVLLEMSA
jgi:hypothetical protein